MLPAKKSSQRKLAHHLATLSSVLLFVLVSVALSLTQLAALQPLTSRYAKLNHLTASESAKALPPVIPLLDTTPVATIYLPIVIHQPLSALDCNPSQGLGGLAPGIHVTTVAGLKAVVVVGDGYDPQQPTHLAFYLHGDDGAYLQFQSPNHTLTKFVKEQGWIFVSPQSPNAGASWWSNWQGDHNEALAQAFEEMKTKYNVCRNVVFGSTLSGGSTFWARNFFPNKGGQHPAYTVMLCGGVLPGKDDRPKVITLGQNPAIVTQSSFEFVYGTKDFLYNQIQQTIELYTGAGFEVSKEELLDQEHCVPNPFSSYIIAHWTARSTALGVD